MTDSSPLLQARDIRVHYPVRSAGWFSKPVLARAVDGVSLEIARGETLGLVGESGSGKTTLGRAVLRRTPLAGGSIHFKGQDITHAGKAQLRELRRHMQLVFQDPSTSLNPRHTVFEAIAEPLIVHGWNAGRDALRRRVAELIDQVGLPADAAERYPHAFSGGQRQRVGIARALAIRPDLIVADEPVSALDVSVRAQIINLFQDLQQELGLSFLLIAHDLAVVRHVSHRIAIMYAGQVVETGSRDDIYERPLHPYTRGLLAAVPEPERGASLRQVYAVAAGEPPSPMSPPSGCRYHPRCPQAVERCRLAAPPLEQRAPGHAAACWFAEPIPATP
ncbi:ABC transporter ATP-binding protein [Achromobacter seleniivolatilans]|uniref:ABC transporter ATP-binding protein n=1 Tax=Achromobacter seleniivolatilans TaxID=3047478 RepID=A0ABY9M5F8_9BURK|nr:ABC transporter ATP-binding protein [Achromobacter sp. R39]WMD22226.1 ABC transporter ATP-binding protein [Achromobacter sp. R39]